MIPRGIVITPEIKISKDGKLVKNIGFTPFFLRECVLYWDVIDCPRSILPRGEEKMGADFAILEQEGILQRTQGYFLVKEDKTDGSYTLKVPFDHPREFWRIAQLYSYLKHREDGELWSMGRTASDPFITKPELSSFVFVESSHGPTTSALVLNGSHSRSSADLVYKGAAVEFELYNAIPVPVPDEPIEKILKFKQRRRDEFAKFRHAMEDLYQQVTDSGDIIRGKVRAVETLELALVDLHRVMEEAGIRRSLSTIKPSWSLPDIVQGAATWAPIAASGVLTVTSSIVLAVLGGVVGAIGGAVAQPLLKSTLDPSALKPKVPDNLKPYVYLYYMEKELGD